MGPDDPVQGDLCPICVLHFKGYECITFFRTTVSIPPLLGQPYQILPYGPPQADERLQMIAGNDQK